MSHGMSSTSFLYRGGRRNSATRVCASSSGSSQIEKFSDCKLHDDAPDGMHSFQCNRVKSNAERRRPMAPHYPKQMSIPNVGDACKSHWTYEGCQLSPSAVAMSYADDIATFSVDRQNIFSSGLDCEASDTQSLTSGLTEETYISAKEGGLPLKVKNEVPPYVFLVDNESNEEVPEIAGCRSHEVGCSSFSTHSNSPNPISPSTSDEESPFLQAKIMDLPVINYSRDYPEYALASGQLNATSSPTTVIISPPTVEKFLLTSFESDVGMHGISCDQDARSIKSERPSCSTSSSSSAASSTATFSTLLESEDSSESSLFSEPLDSVPSFQEHRTSCSNLSLKSLKLRKAFEWRQKQLRRLSMGDKGYRNYLSRQEELVEQDARLCLSIQRRLNKKSKSDLSGIHLSETTTGTQANDMAEPSPDNAPRRTAFLQKIRRSFLFERYHTAPSIGAMAVYLVAHTSCYELIYQLHLGAFFSVQKWPLVYGLTFFVGVALVRMSGSIWNWLGSDLYEGVKFDMHNKLRLRDLDARLMRWIRKRKQIRLILDIVGVYMCFISIGYAWNELLLPAVCSVDNKVLEQLPSRAYGVDTWNVDVLLEGSNRSSQVRDGVTNNRLRATQEGVWSFLKQDQCMAVDSAHFFAVKAALDEADAEYLYSKLSYSSYFALYGWENPPFVSSQCQLAFNLVNSIVAVVVLFRIGVGFWDE